MDKITEATYHLYYKLHKTEYRHLKETIETITQHNQQKALLKVAIYMQKLNFNPYLVPYRKLKRDQIHESEAQNYKTYMENTKLLSPGVLDTTPNT